MRNMLAAVGPLFASQMFHNSELFPCRVAVKYQVADRVVRSRRSGIAIRWSFDGTDRDSSDTHPLHSVQVGAHSEETIQGGLAIHGLIQTLARYMSMMRRYNNDPR
jgi:hypothetical protein